MRCKLSAHPPGVTPVSNSRRRTRPPALADLNQRGEPVFGQRGIDRLAPLQHRGIQHRNLLASPRRESPGWPLVRQQHIHNVVADRQDRQLIYRLQRKHLARPLSVRRPRFDWPDFGRIRVTHRGS